MKPEIHLPRVNSGKISLGKMMFPRAKVRSVTTAIIAKQTKPGDFKTIQMYFFPMTCDECLKIPLVILVVQTKYNFDVSDPPRLHQMAPLNVQISKNF